MKVITINSPKYGIKEVLVDDEDYDKLLKLTWHVTKGRMSFYALTNIKKEEGKGHRLLGMHRYIMGLTHKDKDVHIDHIDFDGLNNRKNNLRKCSRSQNSMNGRSFGVSKYLGVAVATNKHTYGTYKYWVVNIKINGKQKFLGSFPFTNDGEIKAAKKYDEIAKQNFGEFANLNFKSDD